MTAPCHIGAGAAPFVSGAGALPDAPRQGGFAAWRRADHFPRSVNALPAVIALVALAAAVAGMADRELLARIVARDMTALRALYDACASRAMAIALRLLHDRAEAEDVVQETWVEVWKRAAQYDERRGGVVAWVCTIARTRAIDRLRARGSAARAEASAGTDAVEDVAPAASELAESRQDQERVAAALAQLPPEQRRALELAYFDGLTQREIAERTGDPLGTVKTRVRLALRKLSELLSEPRGRA
jgi:RNA polymerase sigma-70 factor (ECF subfamily)